MRRTVSIGAVASLVGLALYPASAGAQNVTGTGPQLGTEPESNTGVFVSLVQDPLVLVALFVGGTVAAVAIERRSTTEMTPDEEDEDPLDPRRRAVASAVGAAADALADDAADAFRAWTDLALELGIEEPATATASDLRTRALEAGLAEEDADRLADQFEVLRYGGAATDRREREAVEALRAVERRYGEDAHEPPATAADA